MFTIWNLSACFCAWLNQCPVLCVCCGRGEECWLKSKYYRCSLISLTSLHSDLGTPALHPHSLVALTATDHPAEAWGVVLGCSAGWWEPHTLRRWLPIPRGHLLCLQKWFAFALACAAVTDLRCGAKAFWQLNGSIFYFKSLQEKTVTSNCTASKTRAAFSLCL